MSTTTPAPTTLDTCPHDHGGKRPAWCVGFRTTGKGTDPAAYVHLGRHFRAEVVRGVWTDGTPFAATRDVAGITWASDWAAVCDAVANPDVRCIGMIPGNPSNYGHDLHVFVFAQGWGG